MWQKYYKLFRNEKWDYSHPNNLFDCKSKVISDLKFKQIMNLYDEYKTKKMDRERLLIIFDLKYYLVIEPILIWITIISMLTFYDTLAKYNKLNAFPSAIRRVYGVNWTKWAIDFVLGKSISTMQNFKLRFIHDANKCFNETKFTIYLATLF